jgi:hypothetical protein
MALLAWGGWAMHRQGWFAKPFLSLASASARPARAQPTPVNATMLRVQRARLWPQFQQTLAAVGDRFEVKGKERLVLTGTLQRKSQGTDAVPIRLIVQYPDLFRLEEQRAQRVLVTTFDGAKKEGIKRAAGTALTPQDADEIETLIFDGVDHLFAGQMAGLAKREIGAYLPLEQATSRADNGPRYHVYEIIDRITVQPVERLQRKLYYFNTQTALPEVIRYQTEHERPSQVEIRLSEWQKFAGQVLATTVVRLEDKQEVLRLRVNAATVQPAADDGIFTLPAQ